MDSYLIPIDVIADVYHEYEICHKPVILLFSINSA